MNTLWIGRRCSERWGGRSECPQHTKNDISNAIVTFIFFCVKISDVKLQKNEMSPYITVMKWKFLCQNCVKRIWTFMSVQTEFGHICLYEQNLDTSVWTEFGHICLCEQNLDSYVCVNRIWTHMSVWTEFGHMFVWTEFGHLCLCEQNLDIYVVWFITFFFLFRLPWSLLACGMMHG